MLCQNLKPAQGDASGVGIAPVIAVNKKDLGSRFTETKNPLFVGSYLSTLITEGWSQISLNILFYKKGTEFYEDLAPGFC